jgi:hypothetical protein
VETISRLEREYPTSRWVKPARSLRIEIAQRLQRNDVLWYTATPPPAATPFPSGVRGIAIEVTEATTPLVIWKKELRRSGGSGSCVAD